MDKITAKEARKLTERSCENKLLHTTSESIAAWENIVANVIEAANLGKISTTVSFKKEIYREVSPYLKSKLSTAGFNYSLLYEYTSSQRSV